MNSKWIYICNYFRIKLGLTSFAGVIAIGCSIVLQPNLNEDFDDEINVEFVKSDVISCPS